MTVQHVHYVHKAGYTARFILIAMCCMFTAILIYHGLVEEVRTFDNLSAAASWLRELSTEDGAEDCAGSVIWNHDLNEPVYQELLSGT
jgi:hypothetical protein